MPRLTFENYYARQLELQGIWRHHSILFSELTALEQWYLHNYYRPSEALTREELHIFWQKQKPGRLSQCAGRAYSKFKSMPPITLVPTQSDQLKRDSIKVRGLTRREVDVEKAVRVLMEVVRRMH